MVRKNVNGVMNSTIPLDLSGFKPGVYFININTGSGVLSKKIIVQ
jgi:hypothetical protein